MNPPIVDTLHSVTLLGGSKVKPEVVNQALHYAPNLVAADGGARAALDLGHVPDAVIGDFDSIDQATIDEIPTERLHRISEQDSTDFNKCLRSINAPLILGVGFTGRRLDHELAAYNALVCHPTRRCILLGAVDMCFLAPKALRLPLPIGTRFSLFPMGDCTVDAAGLRWSFEGLEMAPDGGIGTSNEVRDEVVTLKVSAPKLLVILPRDHLGAVISALT